MKRRWRTVTMKELQALWEYQQAQGICFNGCTHAELISRYGVGMIKHIAGKGWYKLTTTNQWAQPKENPS